MASTILVLEDNLDDRDAIRRLLSGTEYTVLEAENLDYVQDQIGTRHIDVAIVSLTAIPEQAIPRFQRLLLQAPAVKVVALAPVRTGDGLTTLLRAESLKAHHLLAKPVEGQQLLTVLQLSVPLPTN
jgi:CheY-like chemotaxis protein